MQLCVSVPAATCAPTTCTLFCSNCTRRFRRSGRAAARSSLATDGRFVRAVLDSSGDSVQDIGGSALQQSSLHLQTPASASRLPSSPLPPAGRGSSGAVASAELEDVGGTKLLSTLRKVETQAQIRLEYARTTSLPRCSHSACMYTWRYRSSAEAARDESAFASETTKSMEKAIAQRREAKKVRRRASALFCKKHGA